MVNRRKTAGELALKAQSDRTLYDSLEVAYALTQDIAKELMICAQRHCSIFDEDEFCVGYVIASDPLIAGIMRRKFFAFLYLPSPRPSQSVFLFNKRLQQFTKRLWTLPNPMTMAELSEMHWVHPSWLNMKRWCDAFFDLKFWPYIRKQHDIKMLSEIEYLNANREELIKSGCKQVDASFSEPFDFSKISIKHIVDTNTAIGNESILNNAR